MSPQAHLELLLKQHKFRLVAQNKHLKYQNPEGKIFVISKTPSDWRAIKNMLTTLKQVIASPVPTSAVIEEERQRKALEAEIVLAAQRKTNVGMQGAGKKAHSNGSGFTYIDKPVQFKTAEQKELDRLDSEWVKVKHRLLRRRREIERQLANIFGFAQTIINMAYARGMTARFIREARKNNAPYLPWLRRDKNLHSALCLRTFLWLNKMSFMQRPGERLFEYYQTGFEDTLYDGKPPVLPASDTFELAKDGQYVVLQNHPAGLTADMCSDMFEATVLLTDFFFANDPTDQPEWLVLPEDSEPLLPKERRALQFVVDFIAAGYGDADADFVAHLKSLLVRRPKAA